MLCPNCGTILPDDIKECSYCGYQLAESHTVIPYRGKKYNEENERENILGTLKRALDVIRFLEKMEERKSEFAQLRENIEQEKHKILDDDMPGGLIVFCLIIVVVAGGMGLSEGIIEAVVAVVVSLIASGIIYSAYSTCTENSRVEKADAYYDTQIKRLEKAEEVQQQKAEAFYKKTDVAAALHFLPVKYRSSGTIAYLIKLFDERRADTLKEAINLYEDEVHKQRVEEMQKAQLQEIESRMQCPNCGGRNCTLMTETTTKKDGYSVSDGCCGFVLLGPIGLLCGACGAGEETKSKTYWVCQNCGNKFSS